MNNGSIGRHAVVVYFKNPATERRKVLEYLFDSQKEAIVFFDDLRRMDKNGEAFNKIVEIWLTGPDGSVIFDKTTPEPESNAVPLPNLWKLEG